MEEVHLDFTWLFYSLFTSSLSMSYSIAQNALSVSSYSPFYCVSSVYDSFKRTEYPISIQFATQAKTRRKRNTNTASSCSNVSRHWESLRGCPAAPCLSGSLAATGLTTRWWMTREITSASQHSHGSFNLSHFGVSALQVAAGGTVTRGLWAVTQGRPPTSTQRLRPKDLWTTHLCAALTRSSLSFVACLFSLLLTFYVNLYVLISVFLLFFPIRFVSNCLLFLM